MNTKNTFEGVGSRITWGYDFSGKTVNDGMGQLPNLATPPCWVWGAGKSGRTMDDYLRATVPDYDTIVDMFEETEDEGEDA